MYEVAENNIKRMRSFPLQQNGDLLPYLRGESPGVNQLLLGNAGPKLSDEFSREA